jgi:hypothetical protein
LVSLRASGTELGAALFRLLLLSAVFDHLRDLLALVGAPAHTPKPDRSMSLLVRLKSERKRSCDGDHTLVE